MLHIYVIGGEAVHHSYEVYRRNKKNRQLNCFRVGASRDLLCWGTANPYCVVDIEFENNRSYRIGRTPTLCNTHNPKWNREFTQLIDLPGCDGGPYLIAKVLDDDSGVDRNHEILGQAKFPLPELIQGKPLRVCLSLRHPKSNIKTISKVKLELRWYSFCNNPDPQCVAVPHSYFKRSRGNLVTLYHDADLRPGDIPCKCLWYTPRSAWNDIYNSILAAEHFVFIAGWSVNPAVHLLRSHGNELLGQTIGQMLLAKAAQGVRVCILIWDDITSREGISWLKDGIMATYDEYTRDFFRGTKVEVAVCKRIAGDDCGEVSDLIKWTSFTHHQKMVITDAPNPIAPSAKRILVAYVGGLDLTSGRYDTPNHSLFVTLKTAHQSDFYNGCLPDATSECGPREPWHDIHSKIEGPAAWDVLQTFVERVAKQAFRLTPQTWLLINDLREKKILKDGSHVLIQPNDPSSWDVQIFRSLDTEAALFQNRKWLARFANPNLFVDKGIQAAYMYLIDRAKRFIYIENQYFLGSSQFWLEHSDVPCHNWVPYELIQRISRAIERKIKFHVYVVIPLFPEGAPGSASVQQILHWQYQTIRFMYKKIGLKIKECGFDLQPTDFLQFFFLGKREPHAIVFTPTSASTDVYNAVRHRRHPIYVHSKMMIIDDDYIVIGSANINERSMGGSRDTEIAMGSCQPHFRAITDPNGNIRLPHGTVSAFRKDLWAEHLGEKSPLFDDPGSTECVKLVNARANANILAYLSPDPKSKLPYGNICPLPINITDEGNVTSKADEPTIPGWSVAMIGVRSALLPSTMTT